MKKYKLLRHGRCYINEQADFVIGLVGGNKRHGYTFIASHAHPNVLLGKIHIQSRVVPNDGHWIEVSPEMYGIAAHIHSSGSALQGKWTIICSQCQEEFTSADVIRKELKS